MIVVTINGGLGSQMLQYCAGKSLAMEVDTDLYLDLSWYSNMGRDTKREFLLDKYKTNYKIATDIKLPKFVEKPFFEPLPVQDNIHLVGYFLNEKYHNKEVYKDFEPIIKDNEFIENRIKQTENTVSIHVRRGDKVNSKKHYALDLSYYEKAMNIINDKLDNYCFVIFSDDIEWCKSNLKNKNTLIFFRNNTEINDLIYQSQCKHNIIANSSFSWWSAMLNKNPDKIVIAPKKYFRDEINTEIYPKEWSLI